MAASDSAVAGRNSEGRLAETLLFLYRMVIPIDLVPFAPPSRHEFPWRGLGMTIRYDNVDE